MESRDPQPPPPPHQPPVTSPLQLHHHHHNLSQNIMSFSPTMISHTHTPSPNPAPNPNPPATTTGFPFNSLARHSAPTPPPNPPSKPSPEPVLPVFEGSSPPSSGMGFSIEPAKKKRGRPKKYTPDGNIALGLSPTGVSPSSGVLSLTYSESGGASGALSEQTPKRSRGRPPGSGKRQLDALGGVGGVGFTPHVITVNAGEDVASKVMSFSQQGPRTVCILSANGAISNVTLRQPATSGGTISYEGQYEIISLSGSYFFSQENGQCRSGGLSVSLAAPDGRVVGGGVAGMLMAANTVQVIVGSFVTDGRKARGSGHKGSAVPVPMVAFGGATAAAPSSPPSQGPTSESSDENGGSPMNRGGYFGNSEQPMHNVPMYTLWAGQNPQ